MATGPPNQLRLVLSQRVSQLRRSARDARITLLSDRGSWLNRYLPELIQALWQRGHVVRWIHHPAQLVAGDVCFMLSCGRLISAEQLALHRHNLVVHASDLPNG